MARNGGEPGRTALVTGAARGIGRGVFLCYNAAARQMIAQGDGGKIIGAASIAAHKGFAMLGHYSASKWAVRGLTQAAAQEWARARDHGERLLPGDRRHEDVGATSTRSSPSSRACRRARRSRSSPS